MELRCQVVRGLQPSVHAAYKNRADQLQGTDQAVYDQLQHVELAVSAAGAHDSAAGTEPLMQALRARRPSWRKGYRIKIRDGNHLAATEHRIAELRPTWAAPRPGKCLAVLDQQLMTVTDVLRTEDGHAQERSLMEGVLSVIQRRDLWIADRKLATRPFRHGKRTSKLIQFIL